MNKPSTEKRILHLTLKKKWFDMVASGEKKEEYRQLKQYWWQRLTNATSIGGGMRSDKVFDVVRFKNGYSKTAATIDVEWLGMEIGIGKREWGCTDKCFIIKLGKLSHYE